MRRNVAALIDTPAGREGCPSRSLTFVQAVALLAAARAYMLYPYIVLSLLVGVRTEEARELRWDHVDLVGKPEAVPPIPPHVAVWRSVRAHGNTKTKKSRRTLGLPKMAAEVLSGHWERQQEGKLAAGDLGQENGLVFTSELGTRLDASHVRRSLKLIREPTPFGVSARFRRRRRGGRGGLRDGGEGHHADRRVPPARPVSRPPSAGCCARPANWAARCSSARPRRTRPSPRSLRLR